MSYDWWVWIHNRFHNRDENILSPSTFYATHTKSECRDWWWSPWSSSSSYSMLEMNFLSVDQSIPLLSIHFAPSHSCIVLCKICSSVQQVSTNIAATVIGRNNFILLANRITRNSSHRSTGIFVSSRLVKQQQQTINNRNINLLSDDDCVIFWSSSFFFSETLKPLGTSDLNRCLQLN
ncbi:hypothetical protein BLOT_010100 [Blomia tropicalis]|nr:hypothetical protein BLOT_010100 [Blomia tropicalis]